ncbi:transposase [Pseudoruegeria sp. M32A2M]|nr:transposase [Pseudoruegeria sp. M32A2M]
MPASARRSVYLIDSYCSADCQAELRTRAILISMSDKGNRYDNSMVETVFKTIKLELIWPVAWQTRHRAENAIAKYIDGFHNPVRRHSSLGFQSPIAFERKAPELS